TFPPALNEAQAQAKSGRVRHDERRAEPRYYATDCADLIMPIGTRHEQYRVRICDISRTGMGLLVEGPVLIGCTVEIKWRDLVVLATAQNCIKTRDGYRVGLKINNVMSSDQMTEHLSEELIEFWIHHGDLLVEQRNVVMDHVNHCSVCQKRLQNAAEAL